MKRRALLAASIALVATQHAALPQARRVPRIGYLTNDPFSDAPSRERAAFVAGLRELGYVPGKTLEIVYRSAEGEPAFIDDVARDLVGEGIDVIVTSGAIATLGAKRATRSIPIVILAMGDPVGVGVVSSLARHGENITGLAFLSGELAPKRVQLARQLLPGARRIAVLFDARNANARSEATETVRAATMTGFEPESIGVHSHAEFGRALEALALRKPDVLYAVFEGGLVGGNRSTLAEFGLRHRVPVVSGWTFLTEAGGLVSYAPDIPAMFHRAATFVDRILRGERPEKLPIELPTRLELVINARTARILGIAIPPSLRLRADRVIE